MRISKAALRTMLATAVAAVSAPLALGVFTAQAKTHAHHPAHGSKLLINSPLAPSMPPGTDPSIDGIPPGAKPWVLKSGHVTIRRHRLDLRVRGLLIPGHGIGPVKSISAELFCAGSTTPAAMTGQVMLSSAGDAVIHDNHFATPSTCLAPQVLVIPKDMTMGAPKMYIAVDGRMS